MLLTELYNILEAVEVKTPVEIRDIVKNFPNTTRKAIVALLDKERLVINGTPFLAINNDVTDKLEELLNRKTFNTEIDFDVDYQDDFSFEYDADINIKDSQLSYLGYDPKTENLLAGYDVYLGDEEDFNEVFYKAFKKETKEKYNDDNPEHEKAYASVWKQYNNVKLYLIVTVKVSKTGGRLSVVDNEIGNGRMYPQGHKMMKATGIVDVILD